MATMPKRWSSLDSPRITPDVSIETVTPEMAAQWLECNTGNRKIRKGQVSELVLSLQNGEWQLSTDCIGFDIEGRLVNGQHRLTACIESGKPILVAVMRRIPTKSYDVLDQGAKRFLSDLLNHMGTWNSNVMSSVLTRIAGHELLGHPIGTKYLSRGQNNRLTKGMLLDFFKENQASIVECAEVYRHFCDLRHPACAASAYWFIRKHTNDHAALKEFFEMVTETASELPGTHPARALRERLMRITAMQQKLDDRAVVSLFIKAWNAYRNGVPTHKFEATIETPKVEK